MKFLTLKILSAVGILSTAVFSINAHANPTAITPKAVIGTWIQINNPSDPDTYPNPIFDNTDTAKIKAGIQACGGKPKEFTNKFTTVKGMTVIQALQKAIQEDKGALLDEADQPESIRQINEFISSANRMKAKFNPNQSYLRYQHGCVEEDNLYMDIYYFLDSRTGVYINKDSEVGTVISEVKRQ